jgi:hypothetical protein
VTVKRYVFAAIAIPAASFVLVEMAACTVEARGADAVYIRRLVGLVGLGEMGAILAAGAAIAMLTPRAGGTARGDVVRAGSRAPRRCAGDARSPSRASCR